MVPEDFGILRVQLILSSSSRNRTGPFPGVKSPIATCVLGGTACALLKQLI